MVLHNPGGLAEAQEDALGGIRMMQEHNAELIEFHEQGWVKGAKL